MDLIKISGLRELGVHGVLPEEQIRPQPFEVNLEMSVDLQTAGASDELDDTVDYSQVCDIVALAATERSYKTLERLAQVVGQRLMERYGCESVRVRAAKPEPPLPLAIQEVAVEVTQERTVDEDEAEAGS